jgi:hypothetical protein
MPTPYPDNAFPFAKVTFRDGFPVMMSMVFMDMFIVSEAALMFPPHSIYKEKKAEPI